MVFPFKFTQAELEQFMRAALEAGRNALPGCLPNPPVGCALVRDGRVIATGFTSPPGLPHAEPAALIHVAGDLHDVAAFVTLEPCSFHQRTPSCARELIARKVGAVYAGILDPHPRNRGAGVQLLRDAGIPVMLGVLADEAERDMGPYLWRSPAPPDTDQ
jgi:pyrimidine deaminase RibD-like protein